MKKNKGFTLAELLVVVAIIAVLVAISIPIFTSQLHKAEVATDWANLRSYFSEIQADYAETGEYNPKVPDTHEDFNWERREIDMLDGTKIPLKAGYFAITKSDHGYTISYYCNDCLKDWDKHSKTCILELGN